MRTTNKGVDDRALLDAVSRGNDGAFWSIWEKYSTHLYSVCLRHLRGVHSDAADAASRSMLVARNRLPDYALEIENLEAWLTRLTCNVCLDIHRERHRARNVGFDLEAVSDDEQQGAPRTATTPEEEILQAEACRNITTAIRGLPHRLREVAEWRFLEELDYIVIARRLVITQESARKRVQQARSILSDRLGRALSLRTTGAMQEVVQSRSIPSAEGGQQ